MILTLFTNKKRATWRPSLSKEKSAKSWNFLVINSVFQGWVNGILINESSVCGTLCIHVIE